MKHTPGKWTVELSNDAEGTYTILEAQERLGALNTDSEENRKEIHSEDLANANLIAAAPELLEACKGAKYALEVVMADPENQWKSQLRKLKSAIAEAENNS